MKCLEDRIAGIKGIIEFQSYFGDVQTFVNVKDKEHTKQKLIVYRKK